MRHSPASFVPLVLGLGLGLLGCGPGEAGPKKTTKTAVVAPVEMPATTLSVVGTNDLHGHIEMLPIFGGYLNILRSHPERAVVLVDGGDMFQGTLASNLKEGQPIVSAYNLLGYNGATIGNHEFDYGPVGPEATVSAPDDDPRGALKARAAEANFPFLSSNIYDESTGEAIAWPNVQPAIIETVRGIKVGVIGVSTFETPSVTLPANFVGLGMRPLAARIDEHANALRSAGARAVIVAAHAGGDCEEFSDPKDLSSCGAHEIMDVANALPAGSVDVIVAGHTHRAMAHVVNEIAIIESYSYGKAFGRVDLSVPATGPVTVEKIHPPQALCTEGHGPSCEPGTYEEAKVERDERLLALATSAEAIAAELRAKDLGILLPEGISRSRSDASALGNLFTDLMLAAKVDADLAITNGGSLRADIPSGPLNYGGLFEAMPFDNRFAMVTLTGKTLRNLFVANLRRDNGLLSVSGLQVKARCKSGTIAVEMFRARGKRVRDSDTLTVVTSDFIAGGGDGFIGSEGLEPISIAIDDGPLIRDAMAAELTKRGGELRPSAVFNPQEPRIDYGGTRPMICE